MAGRGGLASRLVYAACAVCAVCAGCASCANCVALGIGSSAGSGGASGGMAAEELDGVAGQVAAAEPGQVGEE